ncbi:hypothetical protein BC835DRAFT_1374533 [Cytidiella melzeri]|nr:hypothetical protein BC835DRAFT_1374533 [Cytidiella melzeri]
MVRIQSVHQGTHRDSDMQKGAREAFKTNMLKRLAKKPWIADHRSLLVLDILRRCVKTTSSSSPHISKG